MKAAMPAHIMMVNGVLLPLLMVHGSMVTMVLSVLLRLLRTTLLQLFWMLSPAAVTTQARKPAK